jgi:hypothetical protein
MGVWTELVGVRSDLHLTSKWWHHLAIATVVLSALVVYFIVAGRVLSRPVNLTKENTFALTILTHALGRPTTTTLGDLDALAGQLGVLGPDGTFVPLQRVPPPDTVRCEGRGRYKATETVNVDGVKYRAIADEAGQDSSELRHCIAAPAYAGLTADNIWTFVPAGTGLRKRTARAWFAGGAGAAIWVVLYWNAYYRLLMPFYARYRRNRRQRRVTRLATR